MKYGSIEIILRGAPSIELAIEKEDNQSLQAGFPWEDLSNWWQDTSSSVCVLTLVDGGGVMLTRENVVAFKLIPKAEPLTIKGPSDGI